MAKAQIDLAAVGGGGTKCASGYYASSVPSSITTTDDTTGETFEPKKLICSFLYSSNKVTCIYDAEQSTTTYIRRRNDSQNTLNIPRSDDYIGLAAITSTGFNLLVGGNTFTEFYYIAEG